MATTIGFIPKKETKTTNKDKNKDKETKTTNKDEVVE